MNTTSYPSDLTDAQWALVKPLIPVYPGGRPRKTSMRDVLNAIFYVLRTGCQWRFLPKDFPPKSTVWGYYKEWRSNGTLESIHDTLRDKVRTKEKPYQRRHTASIDSQSVKASSGGEDIGRDNVKNVKGRKRHIVVDSLGLLLAVAVAAADVDDAAGAPKVLQPLQDLPLAQLRCVYADSKYHNHALYGWVEDNGFYDLEIVRRPKEAKGWVQLPIRWVVERTFGWLTKCRRLSLDREKTVASSEAMVRLAMIHLMLNRLCTKEGEAEFHYRKAA